MDDKEIIEVEYPDIDKPITIEGRDILSKHPYLSTHTILVKTEDSKNG